MPVRSRHATIARVTVGYLLTWAAGLAIWFVAIAVSLLTRTSEGPEFDWVAFGLAVLSSLVGLVAAHVAWMVITARLLSPYGHPWRTRVTVVAPPVSLVLLMIAFNESMLPWQLWPVLAVAVPAAGATWATDQRHVRCPPDRAPLGP